LSDYLEIAYAAASERLCFFTGTGFSKAVSANAAPGWQDLLEELCDLLSHANNLKQDLFPEVGERQLSLEEAAQVISIQLANEDKSIHSEIKRKIAKVKLSGSNPSTVQFFSERPCRIITTNYDKLAEELVGTDNCLSITPGLPIPRSLSRVKIYHIHGSIDSPENMVVTSDDYFNFIHSESYFSRKLSTVLHENTVVILGYSLGDGNLKSIISDYKRFSRNHVIGSNLFLVSRTRVDQYVKDYYSHCYGIRVLDSLEIDDFFEKINQSMPEAQKWISDSKSNIRNVVYGNHSYKPTYLAVENSFYEVVASLGAIGSSIEDDRVVEAIGEIIETKTQLTHEEGAWEQYTHLARWLIYLGSILELEGTSIESKFLAAALQSMKTMSKSNRLGYSWKAYGSWSSRWMEIIASNRTLIRKHINENLDSKDALSIVNGA